MQETQKSEIFTSGLIHMLSNKMKRHNASWEEGDGLTPIQKHVLKFVLFETMNREVYQKDIGIALNLRRATLSEILKTMEKNDLIFRIQDKTDTRKKEIILSDTAKENFQIVKNTLNKAEKTITKDISKEELENFFKVISKMQKNLKNERMKLC